jgi:hypothetical protein
VTFDRGVAPRTAARRPAVRAVTSATKKKIVGLNAAKLYGIEVPPELRLPDDAGTPAAQDDAQLVGGPTAG